MLTLTSRSADFQNSTLGELDDFIEGGKVTEFDFSGPLFRGSQLDVYETSLRREIERREASLRGPGSVETIARDSRELKHCNSILTLLQAERARREAPKTRSTTADALVIGEIIETEAGLVEVQEIVPHNTLDRVRLYLSNATVLEVSIHDELTTTNLKFRN